MFAVQNISVCVKLSFVILWIIHSLFVSPVLIAIGFYFQSVGDIALNGGWNFQSCTLNTLSAQRMLNSSCSCVFEIR